MTDYQFKTLIKMVLAIVNKSADKEEIKHALENLLSDERQAKD